MAVHWGGRGPGHMSRKTSTGFNPLSLFTAGEQGVWYDPSDFSTMFQDSAGATPVTAVGQSVGKINDKSGRGNHATQATGASKPILRQDGGGRYYLEFDGFDDGIVTGTITPGVDKAQVFAGVTATSFAATAMVAELSPVIGTNAGAFSLFMPNSNGSDVLSFYSRGSIGPVTATATALGAAPRTVVGTGISDIAADSCLIRSNGVQLGSSAADQGTGNFLAYPLYIGRRGGASMPLNGNIYGLIVRFGANLTAGQIAQAEAYIAGTTGVTL